ncbi:MAG TPA: MFS transporter [Steroidobacteraceae bacterium]|jgi:ACS family tartrate transporter-like MFS transporter|nr:MFS transporter [Steroidobacteraceae bacterium]
MTDIERATMARVTWRLLPFLLLLYIISWLDRVNVGFAKLQMNSDLGLSETAYGLGAGIFFIGYALCEIPSNLLLVRFGARIWIARIMITWGLISAGMMFVQGETSFYVMRFLLGVAEAGFLPGIVYYLSQWFPREQRAKAVSWFMIGIPLSIVFGGPLSGWLLGFDGHLGLHGWQWMYLVEGLPATVLGFVVLGFLTDKPSDARWLTAEQRQWLAARIEAEHHEAVARHGVGLGRAMFHPTVWLLALIMFCCQTGSYGLTLWVPTIIKGLSGFTDLQTGMISAIPYIAAALGMVLIGRSSDRSGERILHLAVPTLIGALGFIATGLLSSPVPAMIAITIAAVGDYGTRGPFWALPGKFLTGSSAAAAIALINSMGAVGGFVGPYAVGYLKDATGSFTGPLFLLAGVLFAGSVMTLFLRRSPTLRDSSATTPANVT